MNETLTGSDQGTFITLSLHRPFTFNFANKSAKGESVHSTQCTIHMGKGTQGSYKPRGFKTIYKYSAIKHHHSNE